MELLEIVVQGLQGAHELVRVPFAPGVTVLPSSPRERLYVRLAIDLLYPKGTEPTLNDVDDPGAQSRVGVTVVGRDNQRYRLLLDVKSGRRALQKLVGDKADVVTSSANEIAQAVTATLGFPQEDVLRELLFSTREDLPSKRAKIAVGAGAAAAGEDSGKVKAEKPLPPGFEQTNPGVSGSDKPLPPGFSDFGAAVGGGGGGGGGGGAAARGGRSDEQIRRRIAELEEILRTQGSLKELEFEMDGLQKKLFEIDAKLKPLLTMRKSVQQAEEQLQRFAGLETIPSDLVAKGERLRKIRLEHDRDVGRLEDERRMLLESAQTLDQRGRQKPLEVAQKDPFVLYGTAAGVGAIAVALVGGMAMPELRWVAFLDIPALGVALYGGLRVLASLEEGERARRRIERLDVDKKRLADRFKIDEEQVLGILNKHGFTLEQLPDLEAQLKVRDDARTVLATTRTALLEAARAGDVVNYEAEQADAQARLRALEEKLTNASAGFSSTGDIQYEKEELEALLAGGIEQRGSSSPTSSPTHAPLAELTGEDMVIHTAERAAYGGSGTPAAAAADRGAAEDLARRLVLLAADVLMVAPEDVGNQVKGRATQILGALSDGRLKDAQFGGRGEVTVVDAADDTIPFGLLPAFDRDLTWLAVKIALIELVVKRGRLPVIFDRALDFLADAKGPMLQKMLTFLASSTQVVSISEKPALGGRPS